MRILVILLCASLTACVVATEPAPSAAQEQNTEMRDAIQAPIEKANKVEDQVLDGVEKQKADIEAAGG
jgi:hypothetical protein